MSAKTIIRVKRRLEDDPANAVVLSFKKKKIDDKAVLTFSGTVKNKDDVATTKAINFHGVSTNKQPKDLKSTLSNIQLRNRDENRARSKESRFKILSLNRLVECTDGVEGNSEQFTILDVDAHSDDSEDCLAAPNYVYDLYSNEFMTDNDVDETCIEHILSVQPIYSEQEYRSSEDCEEIDPYEEDSNEEDNWRNDYPDSDHSINDDDMRLAASLYGMGIDNGLDLSDDSDDVHYQVASGLSPPTGFDAYKSRILKELNQVHVLDSISDDEDDGDGGSNDISCD